MGRYLKPANKKAKSETFSLKPKHLVMLEYIVKITKKKRSVVIQKLIEDTYNSLMEEE